jgi:juvenile-hormone esterase
MRPLGDKPPCIQRDIFSYRVQLMGDEDCLYLNVYRPVKPDDRRLPVLVYFPHGNLLYGSGHSRDVSPNTIMESSEVILVVAQYRVGLLGFFTTGGHWAPGNVGLKDQLLALQWVKANIDFFRGDTFDITVFGDASVQYHLLRENISRFSGGGFCGFCVSYFCGIPQLFTRLLSAGVTSFPTIVELGR